MDTSLFPKREEWGTGDEALDVKLSAMLKKTLENLDFENIIEFYDSALQIKPRAFNPTFYLTIEWLVKALLSFNDPETPINHSLMKLKGKYGLKNKLNFEWKDKEKVLSELKLKKHVRYGDQLDFSILRPDIYERNPFILKPLKRSEFDFHIKIIFKDFKNYLGGSGDKKDYQNEFFKLLRNTQSIIVIDEFAEIWFHDGLLYALPTFSLES